MVKVSFLLTLSGIHFEIMCSFKKANIAGNKNKKKFCKAITWLLNEKKMAREKKKERRVTYKLKEK